ncbi:MAG: glycosyltransferase family 4 protein [Bacteroidota bacterium]|nr:glycosyltransferase family 4 protein [Bacteroidota bacterium]MDX5431507.1 glycosyltransferase family 4 protein [Bacteroidota bacterium]MDX5470231.1 glycosyltransferase family 4 protein [Bacteroidota bacterium]
MKILFLSHRIPWPVKDGGALAIHNNLKGFVDAGHEVKFLALNPKKDGVNLNGVPEYFRKAAAEVVDINTDLKPFDAFLNLFSSESYHVSRFHSEAFEELLIRTLRSQSFEVVHMEGAFIAQYVSLIRQYTKACLVLREHNVEYKIWREMAAKSGMLRGAYLRLLADRLQKFEEQLWQQVDLIDAISPDELAVFRQFNPKAFLGSAGFDLEDYLKVDKPAEEKTLFHLGSMDWQPNKQAILWLLNEVWPAIHQKFPDWQLRLAGKKMPAEWIRDAGVVKIEGEVPTATGYMSQYQVMIVPLLSGSGIRIKTIEAMAMGKAVISTTVGVRGLGVEPGKEVLIADTPKAFVEAIQQLENDPTLAARLGEAARLKVTELFKNENHIARLIEKYRNCKP